MSEEQGHIYRVARADREQLLALIEKYVGDAGWTFGGAAQWDFVAERGRVNLRPIDKFTAQARIDVSGDFGHAFSDRAEVRWKRRDDGAYDVLILCEDEQQIDGATPLRVRHWNIQTQVWEDRDWSIRCPEKAAIRQTAGRPSIAYIDYIAPNGAVQFQRLLKVG